VFLILRLVVLVFCSLSLSAPPLLASPSELNLPLEWAEWINRYAASTPVLAMRKNRPPVLRPTDEHLKAILAGKTELELKEELVFRNGNRKKFDVVELPHARRFEVHDQLDIQSLDPRLDRTQVLRQQDRFRQMLSVMHELIGSRSQDELLIIFTGATHAWDLYFSVFLKPDISNTDPLYRVKNEVLYAESPFEMDTIFYTEDHYRFMGLLRGAKEPVDSLRQHSGHLYAAFLGRLHFYNRLHSGLIQFDSLVKSEPRRPGVIVFMDIHHLNSTSLYRDLPSAVSLRAAGFRTVRVALEGWKHQREYKLEQMERFFRTDAERVLGKEDQEYYRKFRKESFEALQSGFVYSEGKKAFFEKIQSYHRSNIPVRLTGLEEFERI